MRKTVRKRSIMLLIAGLLVLAGMGTVTHEIDHAGQPTDAVCSICVSAAHGKSPPPAIVVEPQATVSTVWPSADPVSSRSSSAELLPPVRAPPLEVSA